MAEEERIWNIGVVLSTGEHTLFGMLCQPNSRGEFESKNLKTIEAYLPKGHKKGGQSAPRFQRIYLSALDKYKANIIDTSLKVFRKDGVTQIEKLIVCGNGIRVSHLYEDLQKYFKCEEHKALTFSDLLEIPDITRVKSKIDINEILRTKLDLLLFSKEILDRLSEVEIIYALPNVELDDTLIQSGKVQKVNDLVLTQYQGMIAIRYQGNHDVKESYEEDSFEEVVHESSLCKEVMM